MNCPYKTILSNRDYSARSVVPRLAKLPEGVIQQIGDHPRAAITVI